MQISLKDKIYKAICILNDKFPDYDFCIVGSSSLYIRDINYKDPQDLDIVILNENHKYKTHKDYKNIVAYAVYNETGLYIDALDINHGNFEYDIIDFYDKKIKVIKPESYLEMKKKFSELKHLSDNKKEKHKKTISVLETLINNKI